MSTNDAITPELSVRREEQFAIFRRTVHFFCNVFSKKVRWKMLHADSPTKTMCHTITDGCWRRGWKISYPRTSNGFVGWSRSFRSLWVRASWTMAAAMEWILFCWRRWAMTLPFTRLRRIRYFKAMASATPEPFPSLKIRFVNARKEPLPEGLDAVSLNEVAHHIEPVERVFETAARMLKPTARCSC